jgi:hypothetical protein
LGQLLGGVHPAACQCWPRWLPTFLPAGIEKWGIVDANGTKMYAYEVDGMGNTLVRWQQLTAAGSDGSLGAAWPPTFKQSGQQPWHRHCKQQAVRYNLLRAHPFVLLPLPSSCLAAG